VIVIDSSGWVEFFTDGPLGRRRAISAMHRTRIVPVDQQLALTSADLSLEHGLATARFTDSGDRPTYMPKKPAST